MARKASRKKGPKQADGPAATQSILRKDKTPEAFGDEEWTSRVRMFADMAARRARGELVMLPTMLPKEERRLYVRRTLLEDHRFRVHNRPEGAQEKFQKLAKSVWHFFRGTALLYYRDQLGSDGHLPVVLTIGDVHPENFGVMPNEDGAPVFGLNDFDEAYFAPFSWDVKRGATGFRLCAEENGRSKGEAKAAARTFVEAYLGGLRAFRENDRERWHEFRIDNSPPMIKELLQNSISSRRKFLEEMIDLEKGEFWSTEEIVPHSAHVEEFQKVITTYAKSESVKIRGHKGHFQVKDVAIKKGSGTASLGLDRYFVLVDGPSDDPHDDILLELKQARQSALAGLVPSADIEDGKANRVFQSHHVHLAGGDPYYGAAEIDGRSFLVRERSPFKEDIDVEDLDAEGWCEYAGICGEVLAQAHARSDEDTGAMKGSAEVAILESVKRDVFVQDVLRFAKGAIKRLRKDYKQYCSDLEIGAFDVL